LTELSPPRERVGKNRGATINELIPIHRCDHGMPKAQRLDRGCHAAGLFIIDRPRPAWRDRTVVAASRADIAKNQEGSGARVPTFPRIRAAGFFTNGMELEPVHRLFEVEIIRPGFRCDFEPSRETRTADSRRRPKLVEGNKAHGVSFDGSNSEGCSRIRLSSFRTPAPCTPSRALWSQDNVTFMRRPTFS